jgi:hypothetical protein
MAVASRPVRMPITIAYFIVSLYAKMYGADYREPEDWTNYRLMMVQSDVLEGDDRLSPL